MTPWWLTSRPSWMYLRVEYDEGSVRAQEARGRTYRLTNTKERRDKINCTRHVLSGQRENRLTDRRRKKRREKQSVYLHDWSIVVVCHDLGEKAMETILLSIHAV